MSKNGRDTHKAETRVKTSNAVAAANGKLLTNGKAPGVLLTPTPGRLQYRAMRSQYFAKLEQDARERYERARRFGLEGLVTYHPTSSR